MSLYDVYRHPIRQHYRAAVCSGATVFQLITLILTLLCPYLIAFRSHGFWLRTNTYREQPEVHYKHQFVLLLQSAHVNEYWLWSTYPALNQMVGGRQRIASVSSREIDENTDGKPDRIQLRARVPLQGVEPPVHAVQALFIFDYKLQLQSRFQMETAVHIDETNLLPCSRLHVIGDLSLRQRQPLWYAGLDSRYDKPIVNAAHLLRADAYLWHTLILGYNERNVSTSLRPFVRTWQPTPLPNNRTADVTPDNRLFELELEIRIPEEHVLYYCGFWELIKWAWLQYLAVLLIFVFIFARLREIVFRNRLVAAVPQPVYDVKS